MGGAEPVTCTVGIGPLTVGLLQEIVCAILDPAGSAGGVVMVLGRGRGDPLKCDHAAMEVMEEGA